MDLVSEEQKVSIERCRCVAADRSYLDPDPRVLLSVRLFAFHLWFIPELLLLQTVMPAMCVAAVRQILKRGMKSHMRRWQSATSRSGD